MKKLVRVILVVCSLLFVLVSCGPDYRFEAVYPEGYDAEYFYNNYVEADPNLTHLYASKNDAGRYSYSGQYYRYYAIKDVPIDEYVCYSRDAAYLDPNFSSYVARNKDMEISEPEILSYEVSSAELYWLDGLCYKDKNRDMEALGQNACYETIATIDATAFQNHLALCLETGNYVSDIEPPPSLISQSVFDQKGIQQHLLKLKIRVHFSKYENMVWDADVVKSNDTYYVVYQLIVVSKNFPEGYYSTVYVPLDETVAALIPAIE